MVFTRLNKGKPIGIKETIIVTVSLSFLIIGFSFAVPLKLQLDWNAFNTPGIKTDLGIITKLPIDTNNVEIFNSELGNRSRESFKNREEGSEFLWNQNEYIARFNEHDFSILDSAGERFIYQDLKGYDYIRELHCLQFGLSSDHDAYLAVYANLRATSFNGIFLVYDTNGQCIYQELVEMIRAITLGKMMHEEVGIVTIGHDKLPQSIYIRK